MFTINHRTYARGCILQTAILLGSLTTIGFTLVASAGAHAAEDPERAMLDLDASNFDNPTMNAFWPLTPGTQLVFEGFTDEDGVRTAHRIEATVTDLTKVIGGVRTTIIHELDYVEDQVEEAELGFYAPDNDGNVWHLGEFKETYSEIKYVGSKIWSLDYPPGARAGIMIPADPQVGAPSYSQGFAPFPYNWSDRGRVTEVGAKTTVPAGSYDGIVIVEEFNDEEPGAFQLKYYAPGVGVVRIGWRGDDTVQEEMTLIEHNRLDAEALASIRKLALQMEERSYSFGLSPPLEQIAAE